MSSKKSKSKSKSKKSRDKPGQLIDEEPVHVRSGKKLEVNEQALIAPEAPVKDQRYTTVLFDEEGDPVYYEGGYLSLYITPFQARSLFVKHFPSVAPIASTLKLDHQLREVARTKAGRTDLAKFSKASQGFLTGQYEPVVVPDWYVKPDCGKNLLEHNDEVPGSYDGVEQSRYASSDIFSKPADNDLTEGLYALLTRRAPARK